MMLKMEPRKNRLKNIIIIAVVVGIYIWAFAGIPLGGIKENAGEVTGAILNGIINPDLGYIYTGDGEDLITLLIQTVGIAFLGIFVSAIISLPFAFWAASSKKGKKVLSFTGKITLTAIRTFPEIVLAIVFIKTVGPGSFAGVLAVSIHSVGMLAKLYSEAIENLDRSVAEAVVSVGGNSINTLFFSTLPQLIPEFISYTLYRFEIAVRSASILGIVGAGGIGTPMIFAIDARAWDRVGIIIIGIIIMVTLIDLISGFLRKRLA